MVAPGVQREAFHIEQGHEVQLSDMQAQQVMLGDVFEAFEIVGCEDERDCGEEKWC